jgi:hypothetical protein
MPGTNRATNPLCFFRVISGARPVAPHSGALDDVDASRAFDAKLMVVLGEGKSGSPARTRSELVRCASELRW